MKSYAELKQEAREYYALCREAERLGVPVSLDDSRSPETVDALADALVQKRQESWQGKRGKGPFPLRAEILAPYDALLAGGRR